MFSPKTDEEMALKNDEETQLKNDETASLPEDDGDDKSVCKINMDLDDITVLDGPDDAEPAPTEAELRPSAIALNNLLQRKLTGDNDWTHLVKSPDTYRCCVTEEQAAG